ncbi:putative RNA recognition motif containing protein [Lyophyllum shimeji]|uniref:RNA recognition motif containing protein n=1 Tax=Lyophyllum shimeji TaxID=47721 RepID=A0A9P3PE15_LYOSH|nr:putative RNA recognition motif containing protein [Lyophyllum shimeji]
MASSSNQPNSTLYINNLNDKVNKEELKLQLYALFTTYGKIIDIIASKSQSMRGQAFLVFSDLAGATSAMRACEGMLFYEKPLHIDYAKTKSYATLRREDPMFVPPTAANGRVLVSQVKRQREDETADGERIAKREKAEEDEEEMEIDEEEEAAHSQSTTQAPTTAVPATSQYPSARLLCTNLPQEVTDEVLSVLFQQYQGFQATHVTWAPTPNAAGARVKLAQVTFESPDLASVAKTALDGFTLKKGWVMSVAFI